MSPDIAITLVGNPTDVHINHGVFKSVVGQNQARQTLQFFIDSHQLANPFPTLLFTGGHGLGKSMFAALVAQALNRQLIEVNCSKVVTADDFMKVVFDDILDDRKPCTLFFDEAHELSDELTTILLTLLNPNKLNINKMQHKNLTLIWDLRLINTLFATTDAYRMFNPLRNRCQEIYFYPYSESELIQIVQSYLPGITISCDRQDLALVCRARARDAYVFSTNVNRYLSITPGKKTFNQEDLNNLKSMLGILHLGLKRSEVELLQIVGKHGPISAANLATILMVNQNNIEEELEIRLRELGLIESTQRGRVITELGKKYLHDYPLNV